MGKGLMLLPKLTPIASAPPIPCDLLNAVALLAGLPFIFMIATTIVFLYLASKFDSPVLVIAGTYAILAGVVYWPVGLLFGFLLGGPLCSFSSTCLSPSDSLSFAVRFTLIGVLAGIGVGIAKHRSDLLDPKPPDFDVKSALYSTGGYLALNIATGFLASQQPPPLIPLLLEYVAPLPLAFVLGGIVPGLAWSDKHPQKRWPWRRSQERRRNKPASILFGFFFVVLIMCCVVCASAFVLVSNTCPSPSGHTSIQAVFLNATQK